MIVANELKIKPINVNMKQYSRLFLRQIILFLLTDGQKFKNFSVILFLKVKLIMICLSTIFIAGQSWIIRKNLIINLPKDSFLCC